MGEAKLRLADFSLATALLQAVLMTLTAVDQVKLAHHSKIR